MKKVFTLMIIFIFIISLSIKVFSHPSTQGNRIIWGETSNTTINVGWSIYDNDHHTNNRVIMYKVDNSAASYRNMISQGAMRWAPSFTIMESQNALGVIFTDNNPNSGVIARIHMMQSDSSNHFTSWRMTLNTARLITATTIAHEFGHVIGLVDLNHNDNINKLMYFSDASTAAFPHSSDIKGANVITGQHTTHTSGYTRAGSVGITPRFVKTCTVCDAIIRPKPLFCWAMWILAAA